MGLLDKVKAAAQDAASAAKKGTAQVQGKLEQSQLRKKADENAKQLGYLIVRERTDGAPAGEEADRLVNEIVALESQMAQADVAGSSAAPAESSTGDVPEPAAPMAPPTSASEPQAGDFKLG